MTAVKQDNKKIDRRKYLMEKGPIMYKVTFLKTYQTTKGRKFLVEKIRKLPLHWPLHLFWYCKVFTHTNTQQYLTLNTSFIPYLIASREIRDRSSGQGWASNRDSGNYPNQRYISDSPEQERVLIQVIKIYLQDQYTLHLN